MAADVKGSGEAQLLESPRFASDLQTLGVDPTLRPGGVLGRELGRRTASLVLSMGRLDPQRFDPQYEQVLERAGGRLSVAEFSRLVGKDPLTVAHSLGDVLGELDLRLNERADPPPGLAAGLREGLGTASGALKGSPKTYDEVKWIANDLLAVLPDGPVNCHDEFQQTLREVLQSGS